MEMARAAELETSVRVTSAISSLTAKTDSKCKMASAQPRIAVAVTLVPIAELETAAMLRETMRKTKRRMMTSLKMRRKSTMEKMMTISTRTRNT